MTFVSLLASLTRAEKSYTRKLHWVWQQGIEQSIAPLYWSLILCASAHFLETILRGLRCEKMLWALDRLKFMCKTCWSVLTLIYKTDILRIVN